MAREKQGVREQYEALLEMFPGRVTIDLPEVKTALNISRDAVMRDKTFPKKKIGNRVVVPLWGLASWLV